MNVDDFRGWFYLRFTYPIERRLLDRFGKTQECGCVTLWGRTRLFCLPHALASSDEN